MRPKSDTGFGERRIMNWMLMDMDSYFASVEQYLRPGLRGRPVAVVPVMTDGTCVIAASYDAKRRGVKVGMGVREAKWRCPGISLVQARPDVYVQVHRRVLQSVDRRVEVERVYSIDEWTIRLRGDERRTETARGLALDIKRELRADFGPWITGSIGIAPTRLLAKIASKLEKPDGLTALAVEDMPGRIEHLALEDLYGIGRNMAARLESHGIRNIRDLWELSRERAVRAWGSVSGAAWWAGFHGIDEPEAPTARRSMSHGNVLEPRFRNEESACGVLARLVCKLALRLRRTECLARRLSVSVSDERGGTFHGEIDFPYSNDTSTLLRQFYVVWRRRTPGAAPAKKVDVCVSGLALASQVPRPLFDEFDKARRLSQAIDRINERWGAMTVYFGPLHDFRHRMENKIAFGRIPNEND